MSDAIKVFVGTSPGGEDAEACATLEYTLRKHASAPVDIFWLAQSSDPGSPGAGWNVERWGTPWTALRWAVPHLAGFGRAVYLDCAQIVRGDVAKLVGAEVPEGALVLLNRDGRKMYFGCMVWGDCAAARKVIPPLQAMKSNVGTHQVMATMLAESPRLVSPLPPGWAVTEQDFARIPEAATGSVTCENLHMQPHGRHALPRLRRAGQSHWFGGVRMRHFSPDLVALFDREYYAALEAGFSLDKYGVREQEGGKDHEPVQHALRHEQLR